MYGRGSIFSALRPLGDARDCSPRPVQASSDDVIYQQGGHASSEHASPPRALRGVMLGLAPPHDTNDTNEVAGDIHTIRWTAKMIGRNASWQSLSRKRLWQIGPGTSF